MTDAGRPSTWPKPVTTPSAGVSRPAMSGAIPACVAWIPISVNESLSNSRSSRSRTVSLPAACCRPTASAPPIARTRSRRAARSSAWSFMPTASSPRRRRRHRRRVRVDAGVRRRAAEYRQHRRDLAPVVRRVVRHVLEQPPQRDPELRTLRVPVGDDALDVRGPEPLDEGPLRALELVPALAQPLPGRKVGARGQPGRGPSLPALEPDPVGAVEVREGPLERREAEVGAELALDSIAERRGDVPEPAVGPPVVVVEPVRQIERRRGRHAVLLLRSPDRCATYDRTRRARSWVAQPARRDAEVARQVRPR